MMIRILAFLLCAFSAAAQTSVLFPMTDSTGRPLPYSVVTLYPTQPASNGSWLTSLDPTSLPLGTNSQVIFSNVTPGIVYVGAFAGPTIVTTNLFLFPATNGMVSALTCLIAPTNSAGPNNTAYSITAVNALIAGITNQAATIAGLAAAGATNLANLAAMGVWTDQVGTNYGNWAYLTNQLIFQGQLAGGEDLAAIGSDANGNLDFFPGIGFGDGGGQVNFYIAGGQLNLIGGFGLSTFIDQAPNQNVVLEPGVTSSMLIIGNGSATSTNLAIYASGMMTSKATIASSNAVIGAVYSTNFTGNGAGLTNLNLTAVIASATNAFNISTNFITGDSMRVLDRGIDFYGVNRFNWSNTIGVLATNGPLTLWFWGNGWVRDSIYISAVTNMAKSKPLIGYGGFLTFKLGSQNALRYFNYWNSPNYDLNATIVDFGVPNTTDPQLTNWLAYATLTNNSIFSPIPSDNTGMSALTGNGNLTANVARICYLKNPSGNTFYVDVRTNDAVASTVGWTNIDGTWTTVATLNSYNATWAGATYSWTNPLGVAPTQVRVRCGAVQQFTPVVDMGLWNNTISNGILLGEFAQEGGPNLTQWTNATLAAKSGPIWAAEAPNMVVFTGGFDDATGSPIFNLTNILSILRTGFPGADIVDSAPHNDVYPPLTFNTEAAWCYSNGVAFFNGTTATLDAWGSIQNAVNLGLVDSVGSGHLLGQGYVYFGEMIGAWFGFYKQYRQPFATTSYSGTFTGNGAGLTNFTKWCEGGILDDSVITSASTIYASVARGTYRNAQGNANYTYAQVTGGQTGYCPSNVVINCFFGLGSGTNVVFTLYTNGVSVGTWGYNTPAVNTNWTIPYCPLTNGSNWYWSVTPNAAMPAYTHFDWTIKGSAY